MATPNTDRQELAKLIDARHPCISICTIEEHYALEQIREIAYEKKNWDLRGWSATKGVHNGLFDSKHPDAAEGSINCAKGLHQLAGDRDWHLCYVLDVADHLRDEQTMRAMRDLIHQCALSDRTVIMIDHQAELPYAVTAHATRFEISLPEDAELEILIRETLRAVNLNRKIEIDITKGELRTIIKNLRGLSRRQARQVIRDVVWHDKKFTAEDLNHVLAIKRHALCSTGLLEYVETPVDLKSVGGLKNLKRWLAMRKDADLDDAVRFGLTPPRGVLMLGIQGAGKSMCAKAIATAWQRPLLRLDPSGLYNRYIGESERRLRDALNQAQAMAPIVLWIDEIEKGFASAAHQSNDGGLSKRMFGTLLTWMQEHTAPVFMVATANDIEALPPELLRKGRFDEIFFVDLPSAATRKEIFRIHIDKRNRDSKTFDIKALAKASDGYSGAEIEQAIVSGLHEAFASKTELADKHIINALEQSPPLSITMAERVAILRNWAQGRCVSADA